MTPPETPELHRQGCPDHLIQRATGATGVCRCRVREPLPLYLRIGSGAEHLVGHITSMPSELPGALRAVAEELERRADPPARPAENEEPVPEPERRAGEQPPRPEPTTDQADEPGRERAQQAAPRNRQAPPPGRNR